MDTTTLSTLFLPTSIDSNDSTARSPPQLPAIPSHPMATASIPSPLRSSTARLRWTPAPSLLHQRSSSALSFHRDRRLCRRVSAVSSEAPVAGTTGRPLRLTYLEANGWLWEMEGMNLLVDPILVGNLDFGLPWLFDGAKRFLKNYQLKDLPGIDCLLITQGLDDHCHRRTLSALSNMQPNLKVIGPPSAKAILSSLFRNVTYLSPGNGFELKGNNGSKIYIRATAGPVLGPPWQDPENGYLVSLEDNLVSLYYEPHCVCDLSLLENTQADVVITPVVKQLLPSFTLVSGQEEAVKLAKTLRAKFVVPMSNGNLDSKGILARIVRKGGTIESFKQLLSRELPDVDILEPVAGVPLDIPVNSIIS